MDGNHAHVHTTMSTTSTGQLIDIASEKKRWKQEMKQFASHDSRNEDALFNHNHSDLYCVLTNKEFLVQLAEFAALEMQLLQCNIRKFAWKGKGYVLITINGGGSDGTGAESVSKQALALNVLVSGFTYLFKEHSYNAIEDELKRHLKHVK